MKKIVLLIITILLILIIYKYNYHSNKSVLIIGDGIASGLSDKKMTYNFTDELIKNHPSKNIQVIFQKDFRLRDLTSSIQNNKEYQNQSYQKIIKNSEYILIFIGMEEIYNQLNSQIKVSEIINNINTEYLELITTIKDFNSNIAIINYFSPPEFDISPINEYLDNLAKEQNIKVISVNDLINEEKNLTYDNQMLLFEKVNKFLMDECQFDNKA